MMQTLTELFSKIAPKETGVVLLAAANQIITIEVSLCMRGQKCNILNAKIVGEPTESFYPFDQLKKQAGYSQVRTASRLLKPLQLISKGSGSLRKLNLGELGLKEMSSGLKSPGKFSKIKKQMSDEGRKEEVI